MNLDTQGFQAVLILREQTADRDRPNLRIHFLQHSNNGYPIHIRHHHIHQNKRNVLLMLSIEGDRLRSIRCREYLIMMRLQNGASRLKNGRFFIDDQN